VTLKFLLDEDIRPAVARGLRDVGVDALSVHDAGRANQGISDQAQLAFATSEGRVLVTYNRQDYQALDAQWRLQGRKHSGILWRLERTIPRRDVGGLIRALESVAREYNALSGLCLPIVRPSG
jgi:predicted nuclease of predicted toxin-antitoxin system